MMPLAVIGTREIDVKITVRFGGHTAARGGALPRGDVLNEACGRIEAAHAGPQPFFVRSFGAFPGSLGASGVVESIPFGSTPSMDRSNEEFAP
jgi:hypothetical protein